MASSPKQDNCLPGLHSKRTSKNARPACVRSSLARPAVHRRTASQRLRHLRHAHVANCLSSPHPRLDAMQNRGIETELGEPVPKKNPKPLQTRCANQYLKKNPKPLQTRWANQYLKKSETWANQYLKKNEFRARWANQYRNGVGRTSIKNGVGRTSPAGWVDQAQPVGCQNSTKNARCNSSSFFDDRWQHQKNWQHLHFFFDAGAGPSQLKVGTAETILGKGVRHLRHLRHPLNVEQECLKRVSDLSQQ